MNKGRPIIHGMAGTKIYQVWKNMKKRCLDPSNKYYGRYGGRGITICDKWNKFENFHEDMGGRLDGMELDRIDNNKGYSKENCRWVTSKENSRNTLRSRIWHVNGLVFEAAIDAANHFNVTKATIGVWCNGQTRNDHFTPPKENCSSELKY